MRGVFKEESLGGKKNVFLEKKKKKIWLLDCWKPGKKWSKKKRGWVMGWGIKLK